jgi:hypothetical protein
MTGSAAMRLDRLPFLWQLSHRIATVTAQNMQQTTVIDGGCCPKKSQGIALA